jgi:O-antigen/teichoic acid export membrane protein
MFAYKECILVAYQRSDISNNISTVTCLIMYLFQCVTIVLSRNYYAYVFWLPFCTIIINIIRSYEVKRLFPNICCQGTVTKETQREIAKKVVGLMLYKICGIFRNSFDSIVISSFLGLFILAKYQNYFYIMNSISSIFAIITVSATASIGDSIATESVEKNYKNFCTLSFGYNWISGWCTVCLLCLFQPFIYLWLGTEYMFEFKIVIFICLYFYTTKTSDILYTYRQAAGLWWEDKARPVIEALANLVLNILVVKYYGVGGVLLSTIITILFINIPWGGFILFKYYFKSISANKYAFDLFKNGCAVFCTCVVTWFVCERVTGNSVGAFFIKVVICMTVPNLMMLLIYFRSGYLRELIPLAKRIIKK